jgi:hypothetical protein
MAKFDDDLGLDDFGFGTEDSPEADDDMFSFGGDSSSDGDSGFSLGGDDSAPLTINPDSLRSSGGDNDFDEDGKKKRAFILGVVGVIIILGGLMIAGVITRISKGSGKRETASVKTAVETEESTRGEKESRREEEAKRETKAESSTEAPVRRVSLTDGGWDEIELSELAFSNVINGDFTVTSIKAYVKDSKTGEKTVKAVVTGGISGLSGTYELEIPYSKAEKLAVGDSFSVKYRIAKLNDYTIVGDISY